MAWDAPWLIIGLAVQLWVAVIVVAIVMMVMRARRITAAYRAQPTTSTPPGGNNSRITQEMPAAVRPAGARPDQTPVTLQIRVEMDEDTRRLRHSEQEAVIRRHTQSKSVVI